MGYILLIIGAIMGGGLSIGVEELLVIPHQVSVAKSNQYAADQRACDAKIALIEAQSAEATLAQFEEATRAELGIGPTPVDRAELNDLCETDRNCREHKK
jgi:hypothetical protein